MEKEQTPDELIAAELKTMVESDFTEEALSVREARIRLIDKYSK